MAVIERIEDAGPKKLLAIDGGGIRGVLARAVELAAVYDQDVRHSEKLELT